MQFYGEKLHKPTPFRILICLSLLVAGLIPTAFIESWVIASQFFTMGIALAAGSFCTFVGFYSHKSHWHMCMVVLFCLLIGCSGLGVHYLLFY